MKRLPLWRRIQLAWTGRDARREYFAIEARIGNLYQELGVEGWASDRAHLLRSIAGETAAQIPLFTAGWGSDWIPSDRMDMSLSMAWTVTLYELLADVEYAVGAARRRAYTNSALEVAAGPILDEMARKLLLGDRMAMLPRLYAAVKPIVGGQAAEVVGLLPYPDGRIVPAEKSTR